MCDLKLIACVSQHVRESFDAFHARPCRVIKIQLPKPLQEEERPSDEKKKVAPPSFLFNLFCEHIKDEKDRASWKCTHCKRFFETFLTLAIVEMDTGSKKRPVLLSDIRPFGIPPADKIPEEYKAGFAAMREYFDPAKLVIVGLVNLEEDVLKSYHKEVLNTFHHFYLPRFKDILPIVHKRSPNDTTFLEMLRRVQEDHFLKQLEGEAEGKKQPKGKRQPYERKTNLHRLQRLFHTKQLVYEPFAVPTVDTLVSVFETAQREYKDAARREQFVHLSSIVLTGDVISACRTGALSRLLTVLGSPGSTIPQLRTVWEEILQPSTHRVPQTPAPEQTFEQAEAKLAKMGVTKTDMERYAARIEEVLEDAPDKAILYMDSARAKERKQRLLAAKKKQEEASASAEETSSSGEDKKAEVKREALFAHLTARQKQTVEKETETGVYVFTQHITFATFRKILATQQHEIAKLEFCIPPSPLFSMSAWTLVSAHRGSKPLFSFQDKNKNRHSHYTYEDSLPAASWNLKSGSRVPIQAIVQDPRSWTGERDTRIFVMLLEGCRDLADTVNGTVFPKFLRHELTEIETAFEAYRKESTVLEREKGTCCGPIFEPGDSGELKHTHTVRATMRNGEVYEYIIRLEE